jgi:L-ascorbate metabolism protein UlaG (beta-lactamase superfamily)
VLITHAHFDHLDRPTLSAIADAKTRVIVPRSCRRLIPPGFGRIIELYPDEKIDLDGLSIKAIQPEHWGARKVLDRHRGVNAYLIESDGRSVFFAGDTAHTRAFEHLSEIDLAVFGIGAYDPWEHMHATPEQAWSMFTQLGARYMLPVHHSTFELSDEQVDEPTNRLKRIAGDEYDAKVLDPQMGELIVIEASQHDSQPQ